MKSFEKMIYHIYRDGRHYDHLFEKPNLPFWIDIVQMTREPVLELGCGTGMITIPIAEAGYEIVGIDNSQSMLDEAYHKVGNRSLPIHFHLADIRNFSLEQQFNLIILPSNNLCHLLTVQDVEDCFRKVLEHLSEEGWFVIDVFVPNPKFLISDSEKEEILSEYEDPDGKGHVIIASRSHYESDTQIKRNKTYRRIPGCPEEMGQLDMKMYFPQELEALLHYNGFEVIEKYGGYKKELFSSESFKQIIIAKRDCGQKDISGDA